VSSWRSRISPVLPLACQHTLPRRVKQVTPKGEKFNIFGNNIFPHTYYTRRRKMRFIVSLIGTIVLLSYSGALAKTLFFDDFNDGIISKKWTFTGEWEEKDGHLACLSNFKK